MRYDRRAILHVYVQLYGVVDRRWPSRRVVSMTNDDDRSVERAARTVRPTDSLINDARVHRASVLLMTPAQRRRRVARIIRFRRVVVTTRQRHDATDNTTRHWITHSARESTDASPASCTAPKLTTEGSRTVTSMGWNENWDRSVKAKAHPQWLYSQIS